MGRWSTPSFGTCAHSSTHPRLSRLKNRCKQKDPYKAFEKAMRLLKDGGAFVFVEPVVGEGPVTGLRRYLGQIHRATGAFGDPSLDIKVTEKFRRTRLALWLKQ